jgi:hypothetical protein
MACSSKEFTESSSGGSNGSGGSSASGGTGGTGSVPDANVDGVYTVHVTNGENTCSTVMDWMEGAQTRDIPLTIVQDGTALTGTVGGLMGVYLVLVIGKAEGEGEVNGDHFTITIYGNKAYTQGNCTLTLNATLDGTVTGDAISGSVTYRPAISTNPDCAPYDCEAAQAFSGSRPPPAGG